MAPLLLGAGLGIGLGIGHASGSWFGSRPDGSGLLPAVMGQVAGDLGDGDYLFLPNRRTIWAVHKQSGRFARYYFRDDERRTVERSSVISLDQRDFPPEDTVYLLSDRNLTEVLWVCNKRTGDIQLWTPKLGGAIEGERPVATKEDLRREAAAN